MIVYFLEGGRESAIMREKGLQYKRCRMRGPLRGATIQRELTSRHTGSIRNKAVLIRHSSRGLKVRMALDRTNYQVDLAYNSESSSTRGLRSKARSYHSSASFKYRVFGTLPQKSTFHMYTLIGMTW